MGRITKEELSEDLIKDLGSVGDCTTLAGKPADYYDQHAHVEDESVHVTQEFRDKVDSMMDSEGAVELKNEAVTESNAYTDTKLAELARTSPEIYDAMVQVTELLVANPDTLAAVMEAIGSKAENTAFEEHVAEKNPHGMRPEDIGLGNVNNVADEDKVVGSALKLETPVTISYTGDVTGEISFDGSSNVECNLTYEGGDFTGIVPGEYRQVTVDDRGRVTAGYNPQTLEEYGIIDAATKTQGEKADTAIQEIYIDMWDKATVIEGTAFLPAYPTNALTLDGKEPSYYAKNIPASMTENGLMTPGMYLRLFGSPTQLDNVNMYKEDRDENGIYRKVKYYIALFNEEGEMTEYLYKTSDLVGEGPNYPHRVETIMLSDRTIENTYALSYDEDGAIISEVVEKNVVTPVE